MTKRKKKASSTSRGARSGQPASRGVRNVSRVTKSNGTQGSDPGSSQAPPAKEPAPATFALAAECMVSEATSLKERLAALLEEPRPVTLDIHALQRIDTAGLQVIAAFVRERGANGRAVEWLGSAPVLATAAQLLGLTSLLKLPA
jgi:phospholipid transport system transporter-binding protein